MPRHLRDATTLSPGDRARVLSGHPGLGDPRSGGEPVGVDFSLAEDSMVPTISETIDRDSTFCRHQRQCRHSDGPGGLRRLADDATSGPPAEPFMTIRRN